MPSAVIEHSRYDPETRTLSVWFRPSGRRYDYDAVPPETYAALCAAPSRGRYFNEQIRDHFRFRRVATSGSLPPGTPGAEPR